MVRSSGSVTHAGGLRSATVCCRGHGAAIYAPLGKGRWPRLPVLAAAWAAVITAACDPRIAALAASARARTAAAWAALLESLRSAALGKRAKSLTRGDFRVVLLS